MRIGLIADTHVPEAAPELPDVVAQALRGSDRILHCGDLHSLSVVDRLERIAPTMVSRGNGDRRVPYDGRPGVPEDARVADRVIIEAEGLRVGMTHDLEHVEPQSDARAAEALVRAFGCRVDVAVSGHTHVPTIRGLSDGTVLVNPGSALMPYGYLGLLGTIGFLDFDRHNVAVSVVDLTTGRRQLEMVGPGPHPLTKGPRPTGGR